MRILFQGKQRHYFVEKWHWMNNDCLEEWNNQWEENLIIRVRVWGWGLLHILLFDIVAFEFLSPSNLRTLRFYLQLGLWQLQFKRTGEQFTWTGQPVPVHRNWTGTPVPVPRSWTVWPVHQKKNWWKLDLENRFDFNLNQFFFWWTGQTVQLPGTGTGVPVQFLWTRAGWPVPMSWTELELSQSYLQHLFSQSFDSNSDDRK